MLVQNFLLHLLLKYLEMLPKIKQKNKPIIMMSFLWQSEIIIFPKESSLANYIMDYLLGKKLLEGKNYAYVVISFNKNVTLEQKKCRVRESKCFTSHFGVYSKWRTRGYKNFVSLIYKTTSQGNS